MGIGCSLSMVDEENGLGLRACRGVTASLLSQALLWLYVAGDETWTLGGKVDRNRRAGCGLAAVEAGRRRVA